MALQLVVDSLDGIPDALKGEYAEKDGKFHLDVEGIEDTSGLKSALDKERRAARDLAKKVAKWEALGKSDEEIAEMVRKAEESETSDAERKGEWDKLRAQMNEKHAAEVKALGDKLAAKDKALERFLIDAQATAAIAAAKGAPKLLLPHVRASVRVVEDEGEYVVRVVDGKGDPRVNGKGEPLTIDDLIGEMSKSDDFLGAFAGTGNSGTGKRPGEGGQGGGKTMKLSEFNALSSRDRSSFMANGGTLID